MSASDSGPIVVEAESPRSFISGRTLTSDELQALRRQCENDTAWCLPCGLAGYSIMATTKVYMSDNGVSASILLCPTCFSRRMREALACDTGSESVEQPAWTKLARQIFQRLELVDKAISNHHR